LKVKLKWIASTTKQVMMDGLVATLSSIPGHILALGQEASGRLPDRFGFNIGLCLWHWDKERLAAFQRD
jgi:hypothetical protein